MRILRVCPATSRHAARNLPYANCPELLGLESDARADHFIKPRPPVAPEHERGIEYVTQKTNHHRSAQGIFGRDCPWPEPTTNWDRQLAVSPTF